MITTDHAFQEQHPLLPFEPSSDVDSLTRVLRFLDYAVASRVSNFAMHFEVRAPRGTAAFQSRRAFDRFLGEFFGDLRRAGYAPFCAWSFARADHSTVSRLLLLLDGRKRNSIGMHLRTAEHAWGVALEIADANGLVGYRDRTEMDGNKIGNGVILNSGTDSIDTDWTDCFRIAELLVGGEEGEAPASPAIGFHGTPSIARPQD